MIIMFKVIKMVTNPKTYLACSLKGLYRKADSFRKDIIVHINITITTPPSPSQRHHIFTISINVQHHH